MPAPPAREHSVETIRRNSEVMGNLRKLMVVNRGVSYLARIINRKSQLNCPYRKSRFVCFVRLTNSL
jgi:hypothetical protein